MGEEISYEGKIEQICQKMKEKDCFHPVWVGFTRVLFHFLKDVDLVRRGREHFEEELRQKGREIGQAIEQVLEKSKGTMNIDSQLEQQFAPLQQTWLDLFHHFYRKLSPYGGELLEGEVEWVCGRLTDMLEECWGREEWLQGSRMQLERKYFFTYRVLLELRHLVRKSPNGELFKIVNVSDILDDIYR